MNRYFDQGTLKSPKIEGNITDGTLSIQGKCLPENAREFFEPFLLWLQSFYQTDAEMIEVNLDIEYYNTSASGILLDLLKELRSLDQTKQVFIYWHYDEDDFEMKEVGEEFQNMVGDILLMKPREAKEWEDPFKPTEF